MVLFKDVRRLFKINRVKLFELFFTLSDHPSFLFFEGDTFVVKVGAFEDRGISFLSRSDTLSKIKVIFLNIGGAFYDRVSTFYLFNDPHTPTKQPPRKVHKLIKGRHNP